MKFGGRTFLLALIGGLSAVLAFAISAPFVHTLGHPGMSESDPRFFFTLGTKWGVVNHWASGMLLCAGFAFVLAANARGLRYGLLSGLAAALLGGVLGALADSAADLIGIAVYQRYGKVPFIPEAAWSILVPTAYAIAITICIGITQERIKRAACAAFIAAIGSFVAAIAAQYAMVALAQAGYLHIDITALGGTEGGSDGGLALASASLPIWEASATAIGVVLGLVFSRAETMVRAASLMLVVGRNEGKEWNLDYAVNRVGSAEGVEILVRGFAGIAPLNARIACHPEGFLLDDCGIGNVQLNGYPVQQAWLNTNDMIIIGHAMFIFSTRKNARTTGYLPAPGAPIPGAAPRPSPVTRHPSQTVQPSLVDAFGNTYQLAPGSNGIGREVGNAVHLHWDNSISRNHAEIVITGPAVEIRDLGSSNGTRVNGTPITAVTPLRPGDAIQIGNVMLQFVG